jgi:type IV pilus assembly protein PilO
MERIAFWGTLAVGGLLAVGVGVAAVAPQWQEWQQGQARLDELRASESQLPLLRRQLEREMQQQDLAQGQENLLLDLIGGSGDLGTFLAQMDRVAARSGVQLDLYEPQDQVVKAEPKSPTNGRSKEPPVAKDPLEVEGLHKQTLLLAAKGHFTQLLAFLRGIEGLTVLVAQSDLQLALEELKATPSAPVGPQKVLLKLNISLYGRSVPRADSLR